MWQLVQSTPLVCFGIGPGWAAIVMHNADKGFQSARDLRHNTIFNTSDMLF